MNFLAHFVLAGDDEGLLIGNFIADFINGNAHLEYSKSIQKGVEMHRFIDGYTDSHPTFRKSKRLLYKYRHYSGVILDVFYDHFLAKNWEDLFDVKYEDFISKTYHTLSIHSDKLPIEAKKPLKSMLYYDWLYHYQYIDGIERVLEGMTKRTKYNSMMDESMYELVKFYQDFNDYFLEFWDDIYKKTEIYRTSK